jgi:hypothetical protein
VLCALAGFLFVGHELVRYLWEVKGNRVLSYYSLFFWYMIFQFLKCLLAIVGKWVFVGRKGRSESSVVPIEELQPYLLGWLMYKLTYPFLPRSRLPPLHLLPPTLRREHRLEGLLGYVLCLRPRLAHHRFELYICRGLQHLPPQHELGGCFESAKITISDCVILHQSVDVTRKTAIGHCSQLLPKPSPCQEQRLGIMGWDSC